MFSTTAEQAIFTESGEASISSQSLQQAAIPSTVISGKTIANKKKIPRSRVVFTRVGQFLFSRLIPLNLHH